MWVGIICDQGNRQLSKIEFEGPSDDVDVLVSICRNISLLPICEETRLIKPTQTRAESSDVRLLSKQALTSVECQLDIFN